MRRSGPELPGMQRDEGAERLFDSMRLLQVRVVVQADQCFDGVDLQIDIAQRVRGALELGGGAGQLPPPLGAVRPGRFRAAHRGFPLAQLHDAGAGTRQHERLAIGRLERAIGLRRGRLRECDGARENGS